MKVAVWPAVTVTLAGCVVIAGGTRTVSVALPLVTEPTELVTTTLNVTPFSPATVAGVV